MTRAIAAGLGALACAGASGKGTTSTDLGGLASAVAPDAVRVQLVFDERVDLDLYVTGPAREAVYFANDRSSDGGVLAGDRRCDSAAPRIETVTFAPAPAGPYRIGVDFMMRCAGGITRAPYNLFWQRPGQPLVHERGEAVFGVFEPQVLEFRVGDPARKEVDSKSRPTRSEP